MGAVHASSFLDRLTPETISARLAQAGCRGAPQTELPGEPVPSPGWPGAHDRHPVRRASWSTAEPPPTRLVDPESAGAAHPLPAPPLAPAAVLLPLYRRDAAWHAIFIRRAVRECDRHSGQVGFPGGRWQPGDASPAATALRESEEEIGLPRGAVTLLGALRPFGTVSRFLVTPVVGCFDWPQPLQPDPREVARIFSIPLAWLAAPARRRLHTYPAPGHPEERQVIVFDDYDGERLWGVTARIALDFLACLAQTPPDDP